MSILITFATIINNCGDKLLWNWRKIGEIITNCGDKPRRKIDWRRILEAIKILAPVASLLLTLIKILEELGLLP